MKELLVSPDSGIEAVGSLGARFFERTVRPGDVVGITAGASAPEALVDELIAKLKGFAEVHVEPLSGVTENIHFKLPRQLRDFVRGAA